MELSLIRPSDKMAGCFGLDLELNSGTVELSVQFLIRKSSWVWGVKSLWFDGQIFKLGLGPLFLVGYRY